MSETVFCLKIAFPVGVSCGDEGRVVLVPGPMSGCQEVPRGRAMHLWSGLSLSARQSLWLS